jgi:DNA-binding NarL/FixJ family response regulator
MAKVLIVEDNKVFRDVLVENLNTIMPTLKIEVASDCKEALEKVEKFHPQFILMDIRLPDGSGLELAPKIKAQYPSTHIAVLTSYDMGEYRRRASELGILCFLVKGEATPDVILDLIKNYVRC